MMHPPPIVSETTLHKAIQTASTAFGVAFSQVFTPQPSSPIHLPRNGKVLSTIDREENQYCVRFSWSESNGQNFSIAGTVAAIDPTWLTRLTHTIQKLIEQEIQIDFQEASLDEYASQISRDFEELVWTRELARHLQNTDLHSPLMALVNDVFPTLIETVQAAQLVLVQYQQPTSTEAEEIPCEKANLRSIGVNAFDDDAVKAIVTRFGKLARRQPVVSNNCSRLEINGLECFVLVPVNSRSDEFGWIVALNRSDAAIAFLSDLTTSAVELAGPEFGTFEAGLIQSAASFLASHAKNAMLYQQQEQLRTGIIRALINAIDAKDHYTCGHSDRVAEISRRLAQELDLPPKQCDEIYLSGLLHDVGKIGIPDRILQKEEQLTGEEFELLKQHPVIGYRVLKDLEEISYVLPGVLHHHESLDGTGYPDGLVGEEIALQARIISVADAFDAMTSDRPYRRGISLSEAEAVLRTNEGPQWDPNVLEAYFSAQEDIQQICFRDASRKRQGIRDAVNCEFSGQTS